MELKDYFKKECQSIKDLIGVKVKSNAGGKFTIKEIDSLNSSDILPLKILCVNKEKPFGVPVDTRDLNVISEEEYSK